MLVVTLMTSVLRVIEVWAGVGSTVVLRVLTSEIMPSDEVGNNAVREVAFTCTGLEDTTDGEMEGTGCTFIVVVGRKVEVSSVVV